MSKPVLVQVLKKWGMNEIDGRNDRRVDILNYFSNIKILLNIKK